MSTTRFASRGSSPETELPEALNRKLEKSFGPHAETFAQLLSATGEEKQALDAVDQLKKGRLDRSLGLYHLAHDLMNRGQLARHLEASGATDKLLDDGIIEQAPKTDAAALAAFISHHDLTPRQKDGRKFNADPHLLLKILSGLSRESSPPAAMEEAA
jgi:hypothetical protein